MYLSTRYKINFIGLKFSAEHYCKGTLEARLVVPCS